MQQTDLLKCPAFGPQGSSWVSGEVSGTADLRIRLGMQSSRLDPSTQDQAAGAWGPRSPISK